jgi:hypothetical protein
MKQHTPIHQSRSYLDIRRAERGAKSVSSKGDGTRSWVFVKEIRFRAYLYRLFVIKHESSFLVAILSPRKHYIDLLLSTRWWNSRWAMAPMRLMESRNSYLTEMERDPVSAARVVERSITRLPRRHSRGPSRRAWTIDRICYFGRSKSSQACCR